MCLWDCFNILRTLAYKSVQLFNFSCPLTASLVNRGYRKSNLVYKTCREACLPAEVLPNSLLPYVQEATMPALPNDSQAETWRRVYLLHPRTPMFPPLYLSSQGGGTAGDATGVSHPRAGFPYSRVPLSLLKTCSGPNQTKVVMTFYACKGWW